MEMTWRWYGENNDHITLGDIKQVPGITGIVWSLHDMAAGVEWPMERILAEKAYIESYGFNIDVVESVNVHEDIKLGLPTRDKYIEAYCNTLRSLGKAGVKVVCYNFMPVFDWTRTDLYHKLPDGSNALFYETSKVDMDPRKMVDNILDGTKGMTMPGWEPERLASLEDLFKSYENVDEEKLWDNLKYFLEKVIPVAKEAGIKMGIHPDDPPWPIFGLPRILTSREGLRRFLSLYDDPANGLTVCTGSLGASLNNNMVEIVEEFASRIVFAHIRNVKVYENGDFTEVSHRGCDGSVDIYGVLRAYHKAGFKGYIRPDHGRHLWGEEKVCRPGYGLYDRALGAMYMLGVWDSLEREGK